MKKNSTLVDVAREVGVTPSTVQRALNGSPGVSEAKRQQIKEVAQRMGYQRNVMATMLKNQRRELAVILPESDYYTRHLWEGVDECIAENAGFDFAFHRYSYPRSPEHLADALEQAYQKHDGHLSGVLTMGEPHPRVQAVCRKWRADRTAVFFLGTDSEDGDRLCCSRGDDVAAGHMAADLTLLLLRQDSPAKVLITGDFTVSDQYRNMQAYEQLLIGCIPGCEILKISCPTDADPAVTRQILAERMKREPDISVIYSTSARNTIAMCDVAVQTHPSGYLIGSDLFDESRHFLHQGVLHAVIHKRPAHQAYQAMQAMISYLVHGLTPPSTLLCRPYIVTPNSAEDID